MTIKSAEEARKILTSPECAEDNPLYASAYRDAQQYITALTGPEVKALVEFCQELRDNMDKKCMCLKRSVGIGAVSIEDGGIQCLDCKLDKALAVYHEAVRPILG